MRAVMARQAVWHGYMPVERVGPTGCPCGRLYALCATFVAAHEYVRHCRPNRTCTLLRAVRFVQRGGERQHRVAKYVFVGELNVSSPEPINQAWYLL